MFGDNIIGSGGDSAVRRIMLKKDGSETLLAVKGKAAVGLARLRKLGEATQLLLRGATAQAAFGGAVVPERLSLFFGPNARRMGSQYVGDPAGEDSTLCLTDFSVLAWLARFPQWRLGVRMLPEAPPPPGVAEHRAAALAEKKDPDKAVQEARAKVCSQLCRASVRQVAVHTSYQAGTTSSLRFQLFIASSRRKFAGAIPELCGCTCCSEAPVLLRRARYRRSWSCPRPGGPSPMSRTPTAPSRPPSTHQRARPCWMLGYPLHEQKGFSSR